MKRIDSIFCKFYIPHLVSR